VQPSENIIFRQVIVDTFLKIWYDKYVGVALGRSFLMSKFRQQKIRLIGGATKEMTPDCLFFLIFFFSQGSFLFNLII